MTPQQFISKWQASPLTERAAAQSQFIDLCRLLDEPIPSDADPTGTWYAFEKGAIKTTGAAGWADVWKANHFAWEYKKPTRDLNAAFSQLQQYAGALGNPPLLVVSDMLRFRVHTNWTNTVTQVDEIVLDQLIDPGKRQVLKCVLSDPERLKPGLTRQALTEQAAERFAGLARRLGERGHDAQRVAHFVNRLVFAMFAEDVNLLPNKMFERMLEAAQANPASFQNMARMLFAAMRSGGFVGFEHVEWFNGGLFDDDEALPLEKEDVAGVLAAARLDWAEIDPSIFGTLFERGLDPTKRSQLGGFYTDRDKINLIIDPVIVRPLMAEWETEKAAIQGSLETAKTAKAPSVRTKARKEAENHYRGFLDRLRAFRVLDPACGSGNFLYLALLALKDLEHRIGVEAEVMGLEREFPRIGPESVHGIEINPYAAELARISVWVGEIQWMRRNGFGIRKNPILRSLETIECRDALLNSDGSEACWPASHAIVGNPPFLGDKMMISRLGETYVKQVRNVYKDWLPGGSDLVCYWFAIADRMIREGHAQRAGLVSTNSIRGGANRTVLERICSHHVITDAWADEEWTVDGAAVRVSLVCFAPERPTSNVARLNGAPVAEIFADLTGGTADLTTAGPIPENKRIVFNGIQKTGPFEIDGEVARQWLQLPNNPNGRPNADVLRPYWNGIDLTRRTRNNWIVDFGPSRTEGEASFYEKPFEYVVKKVKPIRDCNKIDTLRQKWWLHSRPRAEMRAAISRLSRYIVTPEVSKHRVFGWLPLSVGADKNLVVITRDDDTAFGILHSRFHEAWALRLGTSLEDRPRYTPSTTFETFPFPDNLTLNLPAASYAADPRAQAIADAARRLDELRRNWLNPLSHVIILPEVVPGFPDRIVPIDDKAAAVLRKRTLTNLYNERPTWLVNAHRDLDAAVAAAYGWSADISDDEALARLLALNHARTVNVSAASMIELDAEEVEFA